MITFSKAKKRKKNINDIVKQLKHILHADDDILQDSEKEKVHEVLSEVQEIDMEKIDDVDLFIDQAPQRIAKIMPKKRYQQIREYADILVVAFMVAFGIRALFIQPFKIPTSSMQPTLFGIHHIKDKMPDGTATLPKLPSFLHFALYSTQEANLTMSHSGRLMRDEIRGYDRHIKVYNRYLIFPRTILPFQILDNGNDTNQVALYELPGDLNAVKKYIPINKNRIFKEGEVLASGWHSQGDHLFVDRISHHFLGLKRGDIIVFNTENIKYNGRALKGYYFIKRLIGLPGDTLKIENNIVMVREKGSKEFVPIHKLAKCFEKIYSGKGGYHGHLPGERGYANYLLPGTTCTVPEDSLFAMGDNSANSHDGRAWGFVPKKNIVGKALFIFWPFGRRWGFTDQTDPLDVPTQENLSSMDLQ